MESSSLGKYICTECGKNYIYLTETNEIWSIDPEWENELPIQDREKIILQTILNENIISGKSAKCFTWPYTKDEYYQEATCNLRKMVIELTQQCSLRCDYCIYSGNYEKGSFRTHSNYTMSTDIIKKSIDYLAMHSKEGEKIHLSIYGGEPLLYFKHVKYAIEYARKACFDKVISFSISTNGTTLNSEIIEWLDKNQDITITITINGEKHDCYRKYPSGKGSLEDILNSVNLIHSKYPLLWERMNFIANVASDSEFLNLREFYVKNIGKAPILVSGIQRYGGNDFIEKITHKDNSPIENNAQKKLYELIIRNYDEYLAPYYLTDLESLLYRDMTSVKDCEICKGFCNPMADSIFVAADGTFGLCEKIGANTEFGNVNNGLNWKSVEKLFDDTIRAKQKKCTDCWAHRLCDLCFQNIEIIGKDAIIPDDYCNDMRTRTEKCLQILCDMKEQNINLLNDISDKLSRKSVKW